jgi:tetratricopeptide (TPR) repeat protein
MSVSCTHQIEREFQIAQQEAEKGHSRLALGLYEKIVKRYKEEPKAIQSAREASKICFFEIKDYKKAIVFYKHLVLYSPYPDERIQSQKQIALIYFDHVMDYEKAILENHRLLEMPHSIDEEIFIRMNIARAYYHLNFFLQSEIEADAILKINVTGDKKFDVLLLKANISLAQKNIKKSSEIFKEIMDEFPKRALQENVGLTLAVAYEEQNDFISAINMMEKIKPFFKPPEYIDLRIKRLKERQKNAPGAMGFKK